MTVLPTAKSETILFSKSGRKKKKKNAHPHDFLNCCEIRNKDIFKAGLRYWKIDQISQQYISQ